MVKCLIRIKTKVNVHLRMINHCYRDVKVRVLTMGPRLLGKALGALPLFPSLPSSSTSSGASSRLGVQSTSSAGLESLRDSGHSTPVRSGSDGNSFLHSYRNQAEGGNRTRMAEFSEDSYSPSDSVLPTPVSNDPSDQAQVRHTNNPRRNQEEGGTELCTQNQAKPQGVKPKGKRSQLEKSRPTQHGPEERVNELICSLARLFLVTLALLFALLLLLIVLTESELDLAFLRDIRRTPEFQQFHYEYFCPLRRWLACKLRWIGGHLINK
uniref:FERM domain containing 5 n=1 Tax=Cyprinus carpio TaxID=7962 RepID=A0A8C1GBB4_CYPCA